MKWPNKIVVKANINTEEEKKMTKQKIIKIK